MDKFDLAIRLMKCFPDSFINGEEELIVNKRNNIFFIFKYCDNETDVACKLLEWLSRPASKWSSYNATRQNIKLQRQILNGINKFLGTNFTEDDMCTIYTYLGNNINHEGTLEFINNKYDMTFFNKYKK